MKIQQPKSKIIGLKINKESLNKLTYTVREIQEILKISRAMSYELVNSGAFPIIRIGRTIRIPVKTFNKWLFQSNTAAS